VLDIDLTKDLFDLAYDPKKVTRETILQTVRKQGFKGKIIREEKKNEG
jgi:hypothetical protein